jgi:hypothetical protein
MRNMTRKSTPAVKGGQVQKKNDWSLTPNYYSHAQRDVIIDRKRPGKGYRHLLMARDIRAFIGLLPDWGELSVGLDAIVLAPGEQGLFGYHVTSVVHICAWELSDCEDPLWQEMDDECYQRRRSVLQRCEVPCEEIEPGYYLCKFTEATVCAHPLLRTLLHEFGHHHDRMTTKRQRNSDRGESYSDAYALKYKALIWERYRETFGLY